MKMIEKELNEIAIVCEKDKRLGDILRRVLSMNITEKAKFKKKLNLYFLGKNSPTDKQAYKFYMDILENNNAVMISERMHQFHM